MAVQKYQQENFVSFLNLPLLNMSQEEWQKISNQLLDCRKKWGHCV